MASITAPAAIFIGPSSDGHADAPRELPELQVSSSAFLTALSSRSVTPVRAIPTTSVSAVQPRIKLSARLAVVLLLYTVECFRQPAFWCILSCLLFSRLYLVNAPLFMATGSVVVCRMPQQNLHQLDRHTNPPTLTN